MQAAALLVLIGACAALAAPSLKADPPRPRLPVDFFAETRAEFHPPGEERAFFGVGVMASDYTEKKVVVNHEFFEGLRRFYQYELGLFNLGQYYEIDSENTKICRERNVPVGQMEEPFAWVNQSTYIGKDVYRHRSIDLWRYSTANETREIGVIAPDYNRPVIVNIFYHDGRGKGDIRVEFERFDATTNFDHKVFEVPSECTAQEARVATLKLKEDPPRPQIPADHFAETRAEYNPPGLDRSVYGVGFLASDYTEKKAMVNHEFFEGFRRFFQYELGLFNLGQFYEIDSSDYKVCRERNVPVGVMEKPFAWVNQSTYIGKDVVHGREIDLWRYSTVNETREIGVIAPDYNRPFILNVFYHDGREKGDIKMEITRFDATKEFDHKVFEVPSECTTQEARVATLKLKEDPPRPKISDDFFAETRAEYRGRGEDRPVYGVGVIACDYDEKKTTQRHEFVEGIRRLFQYELGRFDVGKYYEIDSTDIRVCRERNVPAGALVHPFAWVANASYIGKDIYHHREIDLWRFNGVNETREIGVVAPDYNYPVLYNHYRQDGELRLEFNRFEATKEFPHEIFDVPNECTGTKEMRLNVAHLN